MTRQNKAIIYGIAAVLSWSTVATAFKIAGEYMTPFEMVLVSTLTAFALLTLIITAQRQWHTLNTLTSRKWGALAVTGLLNPVIYYTVLFMAYAKLPAQVAQPINYTWPILLLILLAVFTRQRIPAQKYIGMAMSLAGVAFISFGGKTLDGGVTIGGILLGLLSALLWATYWLLNKKICGGIDATIAFWGNFMFGSLYMLIAASISGIGHLTLPGLLSGAYIGCFEMAVPFVCFGIALRTTNNPTLINQLCYLSPFLSLFFISTILGEPIIYSTYIGLVLIVSGIIFNEYFVGRPRAAMKEVQ